MTQVPTDPDPPTYEELNAYILTRYALLGIDIFVLPESDEDAPMDPERLLQNARSILRQDVTAADFDIDPQFHLPMPFPAPFTAWTEEESQGPEGFAALVPRSDGVGFLRGCDGLPAFEGARFSECQGSGCGGRGVRDGRSSSVSQ